MSLRNKSIRSTGWKTDFLIGFPDGLFLLFFTTLLLQQWDLSVQDFYNLHMGIMLVGAVLVMITAWQANRGDGQHEETALTPEEKAKLQRLDISEDTITHIAHEIEQDAALWEQTLQQEQVQLRHYHPLQALRSALMAGAFFLAGGLIALWPYLANENFSAATTTSITLVLLATFVFALLKARMTGQRPWAVVFRNLLVAGGILVAVYVVRMVLV